MTGTDTATRLVPTAVTRNLYDALMEAREPLRIASAAYLLSGDGEGAERTADLVDRVDAALADAADYLQGE